jgi:rhamnogalacturonyl hydrolase YesR
MTEMLSVLPLGHPGRDEILDRFQTMMRALLFHQSKTGTFGQLLCVDESWPETSGAAMFTFSMVSGHKRGWLDIEEFGPRTRTAWLALVERLDHDANLEGVCPGTGEAFHHVGGDPVSQRDYYLARPQITGDFHGQGPMLWTAAALLDDISRPD